MESRDSVQISTPTPVSPADNQAIALQPKKVPKVTQLINRNLFRHIVIMGCMVVMLVLSVVALALPSWVHYCGVGTGMTGYSSDGTTTRYSSVDSTCSDYPSLSRSSSSLCGNLCQDTKMFQAAGVIMGITGALAILADVVIGVLSLVAILQPRYDRPLIVQTLVITAASLWISGTVLYIILFIIIEENASDTTVDAGLGLAIATAIAYAVIMVYRMCFEKQLTELLPK